MGIISKLDAAVLEVLTASCLRLMVMSVTTDFIWHETLPHVLHRMNGNMTPLWVSLKGKSQLTNVTIPSRIQQLFSNTPHKAIPDTVLRIPHM